MSNLYVELSGYSLLLELCLQYEPQAWHRQLFNLTNNQFCHVTDIRIHIITVGKGELICDTCMQRSYTAKH
jgi:hypothetical protein